MPSPAGPTWIEVALNGPWTRRRQPLMPVTVGELVDEGVACARAGAAIVHLHAYDPATGEQDDDPDTYAAAIQGIRARCDAIVYPTLPFVGGASAFGPGAPAARYAAVEALARRGLLEWSVVDPGSINLAGFAEAAAGGPGRTYLNPGEDVRRGLDLAAVHGVTPSFAVYEPGFLRLGAAFADATPGCPAPVYRFMFSDGFTFGPDPGAGALDLYLAMLGRRAPGRPWMVAGLDFEVRPLIAEAVARGGHVRVGLEDAPLGTGIGNVARVEEAVRLVRAAGSEPATAAEVRAALRAPTPAARQAGSIATSDAADMSSGGPLAISTNRIEV